MHKILNIGKCTDRLTSKKKELAKLQFKNAEVGELLYETKVCGVLDRDDDR